MTHQPDVVFLRHILATLAYRATKTLRDVPESFATFRPDPASRTPVEMLSHMSDLFEWSLSMVKGEEVWRVVRPGEWNAEVGRFCRSLEAFDKYLAGGGPIACPVERLFQGPIADALTHVGQLAMLRRMAGTPIKGENYFKADVVVGRVGMDQSPPRKLFS